MPIHPEIACLGFIPYVEAMRKAGHARIFPLLKPGAYDRLTAKWGNCSDLTVIDAAAEALKQQQHGARSCKVSTTKCKTPFEFGGTLVKTVDIGSQEVVSADPSHRVFHTLDLLRGIAAIAVMGRHLNHVMLGWLPSSGLAVDLFFALSGFVIAHAYQRRIDAGMGLIAFMKVRIIRLYPLYSLGLIFGVVVALWVAWLNAEMIDPVQFSASVFLGALFLPTPASLTFHGLHLYPFNFPAWSLFSELAVNVFYALIARRLTTLVLAFLIVVGLVLLGVCAWHFGTLEGGASHASKFAGPMRVGYSFFMGIALHRLWLSGKIQIPVVPTWLLAAALILIFAIRPEAPALYDFLMVSLAFPIILLLSTHQPPSRWLSASTALGTLSYPIYALHAPFTFVEHVIVYRYGLEGHLLPVELAFVAIMIVMALAMDRYFDRPVRRLARRPAVVAPAAPVGLRSPK